MKPRRIPNETIDDIRERSDWIGLVSEYLSLKRSGQNYTGLCPFHDEKTPSFVVNPIKKVFHCFGCGAGGDLFHFLTQIEGISFAEALERLAHKAGVTLPEPDTQTGSRGPSLSDTLYAVNEAAADFFHRNLIEKPEGAAARNYLKGRGLTMETIETFRLGFALPAWDTLVKALGTRFSISQLEKAGLVSRKTGGAKNAAEKNGAFDCFRNRVIFPIGTPRGQIAGFGGRVLDDAQPKYLNSPETAVFTKGRHLYGLDHAKGGGIHSLIVVEGYLDVLSAQQTGIHNIVATLGTALTKEHLQLVRRFSETMVLIFDADTAGVRAALRAAPLLIGKGLSARIVTLPQGKDPDAFIQAQGKEAFLREIEGALTVIDFAIAHQLEAQPIRSAEDKMKIIHHIFPLIDLLGSPVERSHYLKSLSDALSIREEDLRSDYLKRSKKEPAAPSQAKSIRPLGTESKVPQDEEGLLMLLLQEYLDPLTLNGKLDLADFTHPLIQEILSQYWDASESQWCLPARAIQTEDPAARTLLSRLCVSEIDPEQVPQLETDFIRELLKKRNDRERMRIALQLKQMSGKENPEALKRILDLKKASSHLSLSR